MPKVAITTRPKPGEPNFDLPAVRSIYTKTNLPKPDKVNIIYTHEGRKVTFLCYIFKTHNKIIIRNTETKENKTAPWKNGGAIIPLIETLWGYNAKNQE